jgi:hypothetical protein
MERFMKKDIYDELADLFNAELELKRMVAELNARFTCFQIKVRQESTLTMEGINAAKEAVKKLMASLDENAA